MPQTKEHVEILELLRTPLGLVAVTKSDLVDAEFLELTAAMVDYETRHHPAIQQRKE